ncbi:MAG: hypothetical protein WD604_15035 [Balneolaceae bacterium]
MSYAVRNTIVLLIALIVIYGAGYAYMHFFQLTEIETLEEIISEKQAELNQKSMIAEGVPALREQFNEAEAFINTYDKTIFGRNHPDEVYRFLSLINTISNVDFNFTYSDSSITDNYGEIESQINGTGSHRGVMNFINGIENSDPVQKINAVTITPVGEAGGYTDVNFTFNLRSFYDRTGSFESNRTPGISTRSLSSSHNPFYPLIRNIEPNDEGLVNSENSRLVGVGNSRIYLLNQEGTLVTLQPGDRVYLGRLETINVQDGKAEFRLNKGGIIELVTLEVQR